jgi:hypothetical protein
MTTCNDKDKATDMDSETDTETDTDNDTVPRRAGRIG